MEQSPVTVGRDLRTHIATIRHQKWIILAATVLTLGATIFMTMRQVPGYSSSGQVQVNPLGDLSNINLLSAASVDMPTERFIATSAQVADRVAEELNLEGGGPALQAALQVAIVSETHILTFTYSDPDPAVAQARAQAFMDTYIKMRLESGEERIEAKKQPLEAQVLDLQQEIARLQAARAHGELSIPQDTLLTTDIITLGNVQNALRYLKADPDSGGHVNQPASLPTAPSSPNWTQNLIFALFLGLLIGLGIAVMREGLSEGLKGSRDLEDAARAAVLAAVPQVTGWRRRADTQLTIQSDPKSTAAEAYRTLRTNLLYVATLEQAGVFSLTSATLGEGKSTTTANLAVAMAQTGKRVIAVSCDLRKPRLHRFFDLSNDVGVTSILANQASLAEAAQRPQGIDTLRVLSSGPVPSNPAELLGSREFDSLLDELRLFADIVLVDTPPILAVSDTLIIAPKTDGVILVADAHSSSKGAVEHTREQLEQVGANIIGAVFNNYDPTQAKYYPNDKRYYYSGYYSYGYKDEIDVEVPRVPLPEESVTAPAEPPVPPEGSDEIWS